MPGFPPHCCVSNLHFCSSSRLSSSNCYCVLRWYTVNRGIRLSKEFLSRILAIIRKLSHSSSSPLMHLLHYHHYHPLLIIPSISLIIVEPSIIHNLSRILTTSVKNPSSSSLSSSHHPHYLFPHHRHQLRKPQSSLKSKEIFTTLTLSCLVCSMHAKKQSRQLLKIGLYFQEQLSQGLGNAQLLLIPLVWACPPS